jgi:copper chaperone CopZ
MSTPDAQDKKVPQFSSFTMRPATAPAESCCTDHACATESAPAAEALSDARYSWQVDGMDCAACARKVETAVRQVPGVSQVQVLSPQKSCWLTPRAMSALRLRTRSARRGIRCAMPMLPQQSKPEGHCCATICRY